MTGTRGSVETVRVFDMDIEVERRGKGAPLVLFYDEEALTLESEALDRLAADHEITIVSPPGFGASGRPDWVGTIDDCSYVCLDALDALGIEGAPVIGFALGGWLAAEMAVKSTRHMSKLILVDPFGIKIGGPFDRDIQDIWFLSPDEVLALKYADVEKGRIDYTAMDEDKLAIVARNKESYARFCWQPYMHNPRLKGRLHLINVPTLVVWGEKDGLITPDYGKAFAAEIPGARFEVVKNAGHFPHVEQPDAFLKLVDGFAGVAKSAA